MSHLEETSVEDIFEREIASERIRMHQREIGRFLREPYIYELPNRESRLTDSYPDNNYMCRNGNRMTVAGVIKDFLDDPAITLSPDQKAALQNDADFIFSLPREV